MLNWIEHLIIRAEKPVRPADDTITVARKDAAKLNEVGAGNHIYLTLRLYGYPELHEVVRYEHKADIPVTGTPTVEVGIVRDINGRGRKAFPMKTCAVSELGTQQLTEFIRQTVGGVEK